MKQAATIVLLPKDSPSWKLIPEKHTLPLNYIGSDCCTDWYQEEQDVGRVFTLLQAGRPVTLQVSSEIFPTCDVLALEEHKQEEQKLMDGTMS